METLMNIDDPVDGLEPCAARGAEGEPGSGPAAAPAAGPPPRRGGGQTGNTNALQHGLASRMVKAKRHRAAAWRDARAEADAILVETGLEDVALAQRLARRLVEAEWELHLLGKHCDRRGRLDAKGHPKPAYERLLTLRSGDLAEIRRLLDTLAALRASTPVGQVEFRAHFDDGAEVFRASGDDPDYDAPQAAHECAGDDLPALSSSATEPCAGSPAERKLARRLAERIEAQEITKTPAQLAREHADRVFDRLYGEGFD